MVGKDTEEREGGHPSVKKGSMPYFMRANPTRNPYKLVKENEKQNK
jgi:hypothetical protein